MGGSGSKSDAPGAAGADVVSGSGTAVASTTAGGSAAAAVTPAQSMLDALNRLFALFDTDSDGRIGEADFNRIDPILSGDNTPLPPPVTSGTAGATDAEAAAAAAAGAAVRRAKFVAWLATHGVAEPNTANSAPATATAQNSPPVASGGAAALPKLYLTREEYIAFYRKRMAGLSASALPRTTEGLNRQIEAIKQKLYPTPSATAVDPSK